MGAALPALILGGTSLVGTLLSGKNPLKGEEIKYKAQESPELTEYRKKMLEYLGSKIGQGATQNPYATQLNIAGQAPAGSMNPMTGPLNQIMSQFYGKGLYIPGQVGLPTSASGATPATPPTPQGPLLPDIGSIWGSGSFRNTPIPFGFGGNSGGFDKRTGPYRR